ncbi:hypothetical protein [Hymenobacter sp. DG25B]|uniref:hypothetical protein n=1 Tax=Hymenobacter sp. DG25B TaxID=1385664 RepID=UPI0012DFEBF5|nr:hypothetical protein [Hymenobacter sp. DG25B]
MDNSGVPYPVVVLAGLFLWQGFVEALNFPLQHIQAAKTTLAKVRVPHDAFVAAGMGLVIFNSALRLLILLAAMLWFQVPLTGLLFLVPLGVASRFVLGLALGWLVAVLGLLFSDVANALGMVINLWFLVTPVVYTLPAAANKWLILNPVTPLLTTTRQWLLAGPFVPTPGFWQITVIAYLLRIIAEHKEANCDLWYRDAHFVYNFFTRAYFSGIHKLEPLRQPIIERILASARPDGHLGDTLTDTAWVVSSLLNLRSYPPELTAATRYLLAAQQATGEWPRWLLYYGGANGYLAGVQRK